MSHVECVVRYDLDKQKAREMQFAENYQREDVPPLEQARSWKAYLAKYNISQSELSRRNGMFILPAPGQPILAPKDHKRIMKTWEKSVRAGNAT